MNKAVFAQGPIFTGDAGNLSNIIRVGLKLMAIVLFCLGAVGIAFAIGLRVFPVLSIHGFSGKKQSVRIPIENTDNLTRADGRLFPTEVLGLEGSIIRYRDGNFAKAYRFNPANTLFDDERMTDRRIEEMKPKY